MPVSKVSAKFIVQETETLRYSQGSSVTVRLCPDYADGKNIEWAAATPSGKIELIIDPSKTEAITLFEPGTSLTVMFTKDE